MFQLSHALSRVATHCQALLYVLSCTVVLHSGHTFLSLPALFGSIGNNSQCTKLTEKTKKLVEVTDVTVLQISPRGSIRMLRNNRHVALYACSEITARTRMRFIPLIDGLGHATWSSIVPVSRSRTPSL